jgi:hypothetical protein
LLVVTVREGYDAASGVPASGVMNAKLNYVDIVSN